MKEMSLKKILSLFLACILCLSTFCVAASASVRNTANEEIETVVENYLSLLSRNRFLYEDNEVQQFTLVDAPAPFSENDPIPFRFGDMELTTIELVENLRFIEDYISYESYVNESSGLTREQYTARYDFGDFEVIGNTAIVPVTETLSYFYTHDPLNDSISARTTKYLVDVVNVAGNWYVADYTDSITFTPDYKEQSANFNLADAIQDYDVFSSEVQIEPISESAFTETSADFSLDKEASKGVWQMTDAEIEKFLDGLERDREKEIEVPSASDINDTRASTTQIRYIPFTLGMARQYADTYWWDDVGGGKNKWGPNNIHRPWRNSALFSDYGETGWGGDCQNFSSQIIYAGLGGSNTSGSTKIPFDITGSQQWYCKPNHTAHQNAISCSSFRTYTDNVGKSATETGVLTSKPSTDDLNARGTLASALPNATSVLPGSVMYVYNPTATSNNERGHAIFCVSCTAANWNNVYIYAHSDSLRNEVLGSIPKFVGVSASGKYFTYRKITAFRDSRTSSSCSSHAYDTTTTGKGTDATCKYCNYNRLIVQQLSPQSYYNITPGTTRYIGGKATSTTTTPSGSMASFTAYRMALAVTPPGGTTVWYSKENTASISQPITFNKEGIWTIEVVARDRDDSIYSDSTSVSYKFTIRVIDWSKYLG